MFQERPLHNWTSHGSDAFGGLAMTYKMIDNGEAKVLPRQADTTYNHWD